MSGNLIIPQVQDKGHMALHKKLLRTSDMCSGWLRDLDLGPSQAQQRNYRAISLEPPLDELMLVGVGDPSHLLHLSCRVPPPLHTLQGPET